MVQEFADWVKLNQPDVIIGFTSAHFYYYRTEFQRDIPYISLHANQDTEFAGLIGDEGESAREAVNLLHYCRRTFQWGIPKRRIEHVIEPVWKDGLSLPKKQG